MPPAAAIDVVYINISYLYGAFSNDIPSCLLAMSRRYINHTATFLLISRPNYFKISHFVLSAVHTEDPTQCRSIFSFTWEASTLPTL